LAPGGGESVVNRGSTEELAVAIDVETLKTERDKLKDGLREIEAEQRRLEVEIKALRQREIQCKREIEALGVLIEIHDTRAPEEKKPPAKKADG
jgi:predicted  nucleic acid-binding Zn-ribbon protein